MPGVTLKPLHSYVKLSDNPKRNVGSGIIIFILQLGQNVVRSNLPKLTQLVSWQAKV